MVKPLLAKKNASDSQGHLPSIPLFVPSQYARNSRFNGLNAMVANVSDHIEGFAGAVVILLDGRASSCVNSNTIGLESTT